MLDHGFLNAIKAGDPRALAKAISAIECSYPGVIALQAALESSLGRAYRIGITGPPGAGKSTLCSRLIEAFRRQNQTVGVIAVDPTSPFTGGALLGDRVRMQTHALDRGTFIRSMATRGSIGGLAEKAIDAADILDAAGYDWIILETVGVGQSELDIAYAADTTLVVLVPESGDSIQAMKAGLMEIADLFVLNKADRPESARAAESLKSSIHLRPHHSASWLPEIISTSAESGQGIDALLSALSRHRAYLSEHNRLTEKRLQRMERWLYNKVDHALHREFWTDDMVQKLRRLLHQESNRYLILHELMPDRFTISV